MSSSLPTLLAVETSTQVGTVALAVGDEVHEQTIATPREQTARVLALVDELLGNAGVALADVDALVFGRGPGSFTGSRVAAAVIQGLSVASGKPIVGVSSLAALAQRMFAQIAAAPGGERAGAGATQGSELPGRVLCCVDARMGEVYSASFRFDSDRGVVVAATPEIIGAPADVARPDEAYLAVGDGFAAYAEDLASIESGAAAVDAALAPRAQDLLPLAYADVAAERYLPLIAAVPVYLRDSSAWRRAPG